MEYRKKVISGFVWSAGEKFATTGLRLLSGLIILRFVSPEQFGVVEILLVFSFIAHTIIDSGFGQALIRKQDAGATDYNSVFYLNVVIAGLLYLLFIGLSFPLGWWYDQPGLPYYAPVLFLTLPLSALGLIQTTLLSKKMDFKSLSKISFAAAIVSSVTCVAMAVAGFGVWALVGMHVSNELVKTLCLWLFSKWRPQRIFSTESIRELYSFGSRLFLSGMITQVFNRVSTLIIGGIANATQIGLYNQSLKFKDGVATSLSHSVHNVSYPALASFQDDEAKLRLASRQVVQVLSFILFPVMAGLVLVAPEGFTIAGGDKWIPAIPYFRIFCVSAFFIPLTNASMNILRAKGLGNTILKAEIVKKSFAAAVITAGAFFGVTALAWAYVAWMGFEMCVNACNAKKHNGYNYRMQLSDTLPYLAMTGAMFLSVEAAAWLLSNAVPGFFTGDNLAPMGVMLAVKVISGAVIYTLLGLVFKPAAWKETLAIIKGAIRK